jgi:hypothetical protein
MGKSCWLIIIDPLREFVWKGVGLGRAIFSPFSFVKGIVLPLGRYEVNCAHSLIRSESNNSFRSNDRPINSNSGPALSLNPTLTNTKL